MSTQINQNLLARFKQARLASHLLKGPPGSPTRSARHAASTTLGGQPKLPEQLQAKQTPDAPQCHSKAKAKARIQAKPKHKSGGIGQPARDRAILSDSALIAKKQNAVVYSRKYRKRVLEAEQEAFVIIQVFVTAMDTYQAQTTIDSVDVAGRGGDRGVEEAYSEAEGNGKERTDDWREQGRDGAGGLPKQPREQLQQLISPSPTVAPCPNQHNIGLRVDIDSGPHPFPIEDIILRLRAEYDPKILVKVKNLAIKSYLERLIDIIDTGIDHARSSQINPSLHLNDLVAHRLARTDLEFYRRDVAKKDEDLSCAAAVRYERILARIEAGF